METPKITKLALRAEDGSVVFCGAPRCDDGDIILYRWYPLHGAGTPVGAIDPGLDLAGQERAIRDFAEKIKAQRAKKKIAKMAKKTDSRLGIFIVRFLRSLSELSGRDSHSVGLGQPDGPSQEILIEIATSSGRKGPFSVSASHYAGMRNGHAKLAKTLLSWPSPAAEIGRDQ